MGKRLDVELFERGMAKSREQAKELVKLGGVLVDGKAAVKPSLTVNPESKIEIIAPKPKYVGRGGLKLEKALASFNISVSGKICIDVGASTGGFTDCLLQNGARKVYAVDVGHGQLDESLAGDDRVVNLEKTNFRTMDISVFKEEIDFICIDVSFVSLKLVLPRAAEILSSGGELAALVKPQFEAGKSNLNKNGIVKSPKVHKEVLEEIVLFCGGFLNVKDVDFSPVKGGDGNIEYLLYAGKGPCGEVFDISKCKNIVDKAFDDLKGGI
jgi:23S rRNA (cytidine1920-2'-O)/16S rRNA (cytidine1409-2'-O)-methyltransferase